MFDSRQRRQEVQEWVDAQPECPTRKEAQRRFPETPLKHIRAAIQSRKDRLRKEP